MFEMIEMNIIKTPKPLRQQGIITVFKRRNPRKISLTQRIGYWTNGNVSSSE